MDERVVGIPGEKIVLDGRIGLPATPPTAGVVVCHPHPLYGGDMHNPVVTGICRAAADAGLATLRFDFRGTGRSGGSHDNGNGEIDAVRAAIGFLIQEAGLPAGRIAVAGYSFGAMMALRAGLEDDRVAAVAAVSPVLGRYVVPGLDQPAKPVLLIAGTGDEYVNAADLRAVADRSPERVEAHLIEHADHFWWTGLPEVTRLTGAFLAKTLGGA